MLMSCDLPRFYKDLTDPAFESTFAIYHRRFSTNTIPKWFLAQPMRLLAHNGEINTLLGNINWVKSRVLNVEAGMSIEDKLVQGPLVDIGRSDSANLDSILENYIQAGRGPEEALMVLVPEAYASQPKLSEAEDVQAFYKYHESVQEAWDGPALLVFSDGEVVGAALDRNGLRPARYMVTSTSEGDEFVHVMSEVGVTKALTQFSTGATSDEDGLRLVDSGRIGPGEMLSVDLKSGVFSLNDDIKKRVAEMRPYKKWLADSVTDVPTLPFYGEVRRFVNSYVKEPSVKALALSNIDDGDYTSAVIEEVDEENMITLQTAFGWGTEDVEVQIAAMAAEGVEATFCMGDDAPLPALSAMPHTLYDYFKQRFAQVTNPPIDPLREGAVMSLSMYLGSRGDPLSISGQSSKRVKIASPVLNFDEVAQIASSSGIKLQDLTTLYPLTTALSVGGLQEAIDSLVNAAVAAVKAGANVLNLTDKDLKSTDKDKVYIPPLLAVGAVHHALIVAGLRPNTSIIVTTGQAWSTHHVACLVGYGASAVVPYAAYDAVVNWHAQKRNQLAMERGDIAKISAAKAIGNFRKALDKGLLKILSKMGISLLTSYQGAQIFEALGISDPVVETLFKGTPSRLGGLTLDDIALEGVEFHRRAFGNELFDNIAEKVEKSEDGEKKKKLFNYGFLNYFKSGDYHHNNQPLIKTLHSAIRNHDRDMYQLYEDSVKSRPPTTLRDTLEFATDGVAAREPIPLDQVESVESIMTRFCTGGMSLGALSREAHETLGPVLTEY